ncbi:hypothetical protein DRQ26_03595, partial [bacterium]
MEAEGKKKPVLIETPDNRLFEEELDLLKKLSTDKVKKVIEYTRKISENIVEEAFNFSWAGGLRNLRNKYSSVELQHKSM